MNIIIHIIFLFAIVLQAQANEIEINSENILGHWILRSSPKFNSYQEINFKPKGKVFIGNLESDQVGTYLISGKSISIKTPDCNCVINAFIKDEILIFSFGKDELIQEFDRVLDSDIQGIRKEAKKYRIQNNLRQISAAFDLFLMEHSVDSAQYHEIVGPDKYVKGVKSVDGEDYSKLEFRRGVKNWSIISAGGLTITLDR